MFANLRERLKGWKTIVWNGFVALAAPLAIALDKLGAIDWSQYIGPIGAVFIGFAIAAIGILLRVITTGPVGAKGEDEPAADVKAGD